MKISIIIPIYNIENYISQCVDSILNCKIDNFEILFIDDGSTDNSSKICKNYCKKNQNMHYYYKKNGGASSARNFGLKKAVGEYVWFIDGDDFIANNKDVNYIIQSAKEDFIQFKMCYFYEKQQKIRLLKNIECKFSSFKDNLYTQVQSGTISISPCDKILKRKLIIDNDVFFEEGIVAEDIDWSLKLFLHVSTFKIVNKDIYVYRQQRKGSVSSAATNKTIESLYFIINKWNNYDYDDEMIEKIYVSYMAYQYVLMITFINNHNCSKKLKKEIKKLKTILRNDLNYKVKLTNKLFGFFGYNLGVFVLKLYLLIKNNGLLKL